MAVGALVKLRPMGSLPVYQAGSSGTSLGIRVNRATKVPPFPAFQSVTWHFPNPPPNVIGPRKGAAPKFLSHHYLT